MRGHKHLEVQTMEEEGGPGLPSRRDSETEARRSDDAGYRLGKNKPLRTVG